MKRAPKAAPSSAVPREGLHLAIASYAATRHACLQWHYSKSVPPGRMFRMGVWEDGRFIGVVLYARGTAAGGHRSWNLGRGEFCELVRVALRDHRAPVSKIVRRSIMLLQRANPGLRLVVSFADPEQGHHGGIYQAMGFIYTGESAPSKVYYINGAWKHSTQVKSSSRNRSVPTRKLAGKHRYVLPLDDEMRRLVEQRRVSPAPKRARGLDGEAPGDQPGEGGSTPTRALQPTPLSEAHIAVVAGPDDVIEHMNAQ